MKKNITVKVEFLKNIIENITASVALVIKYGIGIVVRPKATYRNLLEN